MTPPGVFFLAIFQQTANLKQICLYDSAICQQLQFGHSHFKGVTNGYALWSLSLNASVLASVHTYIAKRPSSPIYRITGPRMGEQVQVG